MLGVFAGLLFVFVWSSSVFAAHPLITDDTGTQGKAKMQFEFNGEYGVDTKDGVTEESFELPAMPVFSYGISETSDIVFGLPYVSTKTETEGSTGAVRGIGDASLEVKVRFYEKGGLSMAVKPGLSLPTGNEAKGLGNGKTSYSVFFITTKQAEPWAFHFNAGYVRNEYKLQSDQDANRKDIWHVSLASQVEVLKNLNIVANIGIETTADKSSNIEPVFALGGFIYSILEHLDVDMGIKAGLNQPAVDCLILAGITWRL